MNRFFNNTVGIQKISDAVVSATWILNSLKLASELNQKTDWRYDSGINVGCGLNDCTKTAPVFTYRPWNPFTKAIGYAQNGKIHINIRVIDSLKHSDLVGLLLHEYSHLAGFSHGNNYKTKEKCEFSVPYYLSENVNNWL